MQVFFKAFLSLMEDRSTKIQRALCLQFDTFLQHVINWEQEAAKGVALVKHIRHIFDGENTRPLADNAAERVKLHILSSLLNVAERQQLPLPAAAKALSACAEDLTPLANADYDLYDNHLSARCRLAIWASHAVSRLSTFPAGQERHNTATALRQIFNAASSPHLEPRMTRAPFLAGEIALAEQVKQGLALLDKKLPAARMPALA